MGAAEFFTWYFIFGLISTIVWYSVVIYRLFKNHKKDHAGHMAVSRVFNEEERMMVLAGFFLWFLVYPARMWMAAAKSFKDNFRFDHWLGDKIEARHKKKNPEDYV